MPTTSIRRHGQRYSLACFALVSIFFSSPVIADETPAGVQNNNNGSNGANNTDPKSGNSGQQSNGNKGIDAGSGNNLKPPGVNRDIGVDAGKGGDTPLAIDLHGEGRFRLAEHTVRFDFKGLGTPVTTRWLAPEFGFLVVDWDGNGRITSGRELFGNGSLLSDGKTRARDGYQALAQFARPGEALIDTRNPLFARLRIWQDRNGDGIGQAEELHDLPHYGIVAIAWQASEVKPAQLLNPRGEAWLSLRSYAVTKDGRHLLMGDIFFQSLETTMSSR